LTIIPHKWHKGGAIKNSLFGLSYRMFETFMFVVLLVFAFFCNAEAGEGKWEEVFFEANRAYKEGRFNDAVEGYRQLIRSDHCGGHVFYNLGNAYFRLNQLGKAILNYERARVLLPRDADLIFNLHHARDQVKDAISEDRSLINATFFWLDSLTLSEFLWAFAGTNLLFWAILLVRIFSNIEWSYYLFLIFLAFWLLSGVSLGLKWRQITNDNRAVIVYEEVNVLAGPDIKDTILLKLHAGTIVDLERSEDKWSLISLPQKRRGWVRPGTVENIRTRSRTTCDIEKPFEMG